MQNVIMIGATGMLTPAMRQIVRQANTLTLIMPRPEPVADEIGARVVLMDWTKEGDIQNAISLLSSSAKITTVISWIHERGMACLQPFEGLLEPGGRSIRVHGSSAGDPKDGIKTDPPPQDGVNRQNVVLGWIKTENGQRWLTNEEISTGVLRAFEHPDEKALVVGQV